MISTGFGVGFLDSRGRHPVYPHIVERRENDAVQRCVLQICLVEAGWKCLMSSFVFRQDPGFQVCDDLCRIVRVYHSSQALHDQRSPDHRQQTEDKTEGNCGSFGASVVCFAQVDAQIVRKRYTTCNRRQ